MQVDPAIVRRRPVGPGVPDGPQLAVLEAKLKLPPARSGMVRRSMVIERLRASDQARIVLVRAPAGYGKTSLMAQWAALDPRDVAWISLDRHDDDPIVLLTYLAAAIDRIEPLDPDLVRALGGAPVAIRTRILPALALAMARLPRPVLLVLDDVDEIRDPEVLGLVTLLAGHLPDGSQLAAAPDRTTRDPIRGGNERLSVRERIPGVARAAGARPAT